MAVLQRILASKPTLATTGATHLYYYICDTTAERPVTGLGIGDWSFCLDTLLFYVANSSTTWAGKVAPGCIPSGTTSTTFVVGNDVRLIPTGLISMWYGLLSAIPTGWALCDGQNGTPDLRSKFIKGSAAGVDPGATGGSATVTPAGTVSTPTFTGSALATHVHDGSTVSTAAVSAGTPAGTVAAPVFTGSALATHAHELPFIKNAGGTGQLAMVASSIFGTGTSRAPESISAAPTANTTAAAVEKSQAISAGTPAGTNSAPAFTGSALSTHTHTLSGNTGATSAGTPAGTISQPTFTGNSQSTDPVFFSLAYIMKT